ncbi:glycine N-acyltransferase-like protein 1 isoform X2 [Macaca thibetana thibetana]|uniref:glycine N-acyltransferase-like protein 1 isoform X2 n=1 Tax=Macaca thibetana thibetana TaxID=257877 RepID=UPI0021BCAF6C|nr:glycine N-acyltransferase-like protein 1 isoform X2 [Macaca thibetana thibetana]
MSHFHQMRENSLQRLFVYWPARRSIPRILPLRDLIFQARKVQLRATRAAGTATCTVWADSGSIVSEAGSEVELPVSPGALSKHGRYLQDTLVSIDLSELLRIKEFFLGGLKVYGSVYHINHGNPFNMEVLVDSWPEYQMVITRPQKQEMTDDMDSYTNVYRIFSKDPQKSQEVLKNCEIINWKQRLQIQGLQESLGEGIRAAAFSKSVKVEHSTAVLLVTEDILKLNASNKSKFGSWAETGHPDDDFERETPNFKYGQLDVSYSGLVNDNWKLGKNERSLRYIERCIGALPAACMLGPEGAPVAWITMDPSCEVGMAYSVEKYRKTGKMAQVMVRYKKYLLQKNIPFYISVLEENARSRSSVKAAGFFEASCEWHQWTCYPQNLVPF